MPIFSHFCFSIIITSFLGRSNFMSYLVFAIPYCSLLISAIILCRPFYPSPLLLFLLSLFLTFLPTSSILLYHLPFSSPLLDVLLYSTPLSIQSITPLNSLYSYHHLPEPLLCLRSQVWDVTTQYCIQTIVGHRCEIWSLVVHYPHQSTGESSRVN